MNEITIFKPGSARKEAEIISPFQDQALKALEERLGQESADTARKAFKTMKRGPFNLMQFESNGRRIKVKQTETN